MAYTPDNLPLLDESPSVLVRILLSFPWSVSSHKGGNTGTSFIILMHTLGLVCAWIAVMKTRTAQGAIAWAVSLIALPYVAIPLYLVFGHDKFKGYVRARRIKNQDFQITLAVAAEEAAIYEPEPVSEIMSTVSRMGGLPVLRGNATHLLIDGEATFERIMTCIAEARRHVMVQFYLVRDDRLGQDFKNCLLAAAHRGVKVWMLFDALGGHDLPQTYIEELRAGGIQVASFKSTKTWRSRIQSNFRNHRKIVVVDGERAFIGGHNIGNEYLGENPLLGRWRDTHIEIVGPAVISAQLVFAEDWYWTCGEIPDVSWDISPAQPADQQVVLIPSGPADRADTCALFFTYLITRARKRLWLSVPYFVPGPTLVMQLQLAAFRGVDVRLIVSGVSDNWLSNRASESYLPEMVAWNVRVWRYHGGFMHQKVVLMDDSYTSVGSANFDIRSFEVNFEITAFVDDVKLAKEAEHMLLEDMELSNEVFEETFLRDSLLTHTQRRLARLLTPIL